MKTQLKVIALSVLVATSVQAQKMGAVALLVSKKVKSSLPTLVVENTQDALSKIAILCLPRSCKITVTLLSKIFRSKLLLLILLAKILPPSPKLTSPVKEVWVLTIFLEWFE
jgi:hypothetical protein